jgi:hypothetical protein
MYILKGRILHDKNGFRVGRVEMEQEAHNDYKIQLSYFV